MFNQASLIIPPCLLLLLALFPPDFGNSVFWLIGGICALVSLFSLLGIFVKLLISKEISAPKCIRPSLTILMFSLAVFSINLSQQSAKDFAQSEANRIVKEYSDIYPIVSTGWNVPEHGLKDPYIKVGWPGKHYLRYVLSKDQRSFHILLHINIDSSYSYQLKDGEVEEMYHRY